MTNRKVLESFSRLIRKLSDADGNLNECKTINRSLIPLLRSENEEKKNEKGAEIISVITPILKEHKKEIINKDFGFLSEYTVTKDGEKSEFTLFGHNIAEIYLRSVDDEHYTWSERSENELLFLFYHISDDDTKKAIDSKHKKEPPVKMNQKAKIPGKTGEAHGNIASGMQKILENNSDILKEAENDHTKIPNVIAQLFKNNSDDMAGMLTNVLGNIGFDPNQ